MKSLQLGRGEHGAIIGQTGTGKSVLARVIIGDVTRLLVIDPKGEFTLPNVEIFDDPKQIIRKRIGRIIYRPKPSLLSDLDAYNRLYKWAYERGNILVYTDDVVGVIPKQSPPPYLKICYQMGRSRNVRCLSCYQRPFLVPLVLKSEVTKAYVFRLLVPQDVREVQSFVPGYSPDKLETRYSFAFYDCNKMDRAEYTRLQLRK